MKKGYPGKAGHHPSRVHFSELLYEQKFDPFARPTALVYASLKQLLRKLWLSIASADRVDQAGPVKVLIIMEKSWPVKEDDPTIWDICSKTPKAFLIEWSCT